MEIGTLKCSYCGVDFYREEGGICSNCSKPFCADHLYEVKIGQDVVLLCPTDKGEKVGKRKSETVIPFDQALAFRRILSRKKT